MARPADGEDALASDTSKRMSSRPLCYQLSTRELTSKRARVCPVGASTPGGGRLKAPRDGVRACVAA
eukprot:113268-Pleurochrysis_carterae.AAC.1